MDCSQPGSSVHGIFQARVLEWVAIAFSGTYVYLWLIQTDVWQKPTQYCKAIISQLKRNKLKKKDEPMEWPSVMIVVATAPLAATNFFL